MSKTIQFVINFRKYYTLQKQAQGKERNKKLNKSLKNPVA